VLSTANDSCQQLSNTGRVSEDVLPGGVANRGGVVRTGNHVLRPSNAHTPSIHRFLTALHRDRG